MTAAECQQNLFDLADVLQSVQAAHNKDAAKPVHEGLAKEQPSAVLPSDWKDLAKANVSQAHPHPPWKAHGPYFRAAASKMAARKTPAPKPMPKPATKEPEFVYSGALVDLLKIIRDQNIARGNTVRNADAISFNEALGGTLDSGAVENLARAIEIIHRGDAPITECTIIPSQPTDMRAYQQAASSEEVSGWWEGQDSWRRADAEAWAAEKTAEMQAEEEAWAAEKTAEMQAEAEAAAEKTAEMQAEAEAWAAETQ